MPLQYLYPVQWQAASPGGFRAEKLQWVASRRQRDVVIQHCGLWGAIDGRCRLLSSKGWQTLITGRLYFEPVSNNTCRGYR